MPGIVGLITRLPRQQAEEQLNRMLAAVCHESFYETGTWINEEHGIYVGWTVIKGSFAGGMPLRDERICLTLIFSGEEYSNHGAQQPDPSGKQSTYLLRVAERDPGFPVSLNGVFHGVLINENRRTALLFNDRYGMHPLYYHEAKDAFYFGGEAKAILAARPELRTASEQGLGEFVALSCVLNDRTIFKEIHKLPAGSAWCFRNAEIAQKSKFFEPREWEQQEQLDFESYDRELQDVLARNLPRYFGGPERVGVALTGGMDTRVIMAWHKADPGTLPCYTFGGMFRECQDVRLARRVAKTCGLSHQVIEVGRDFLQQFPRYAERAIYLTEGGVDVYRASDLYVSERAREIAPVKVVGTYGSEIVRHAVMFKPVMPLENLYTSEFVAHVETAKQTYAGVRKLHPVTFAAFRQSPWYHYGILGLEQTQLTVRSPFIDNEFVRTVFRSPTLDSRDVRLRLIAEGNPALYKIPSDRGVGGERNAVTSALSRAYLEFTFKAEYAYDYGMPQSVAKADHFFSAFHFERLFLGRHKFLHYRVWYKNFLGEYVRQILLDPRTMSRPYVNQEMLETIVKDHLRGDRNYTTAIHKMLTLELLHRRFLDPQS
jgi:asparagine synthase (glutamine-hydrolysing)